MSEDWGQRAESLAEELIGPLVVGGTIELQRPFGAKLAISLGTARRIVDNELNYQIETARLRVARSIVAVDIMPELDPGEWALAAGLNDLLQATNHELSSFATRSRHKGLLEAVFEICEAIAPARTLGQAVARHATFSRALLVARVDKQVSWWTGSESYRGQQPSRRLLAWPELRRVRVQSTSVPVAEMHQGVPIEQTEFLRAFGTWLSCTPLTDLATASRTAPRFQWTSHTLGVVATIAGAELALRALVVVTDGDGNRIDAAIEAMSQAAEQIAGNAAGRNIALGHASMIEKARKVWA